MPTDYREFAKKIKSKYPQYKDIDDLELTNKMIEKYPEYKKSVTFDDVKKKEETSESVSNQDNGSFFWDSEGERPKKKEDTPPASDISGLEGEVFKGYKGNKNEYRVVNGKWQRKKPSGSGSLPNLASMASGGPEWHDVKSSESIANLNKEFGDKKKRQQVPGLFDPASFVDKTTGKKKMIITDTGALSDSQRKEQKTQNVRWMGPSSELVPLIDYDAQKKQVAEDWKGLEQAKQTEVARLQKSNATPGQISQVVAEYDSQIKLKSENLEVINQNELQNQAEALSSIQNWQESDEHKDLRIKLKKEIPAKIFTHEEENVVPFMQERYKDLGFNFVERSAGDAMEVISYRGNSMVINLDVDPSQAEFQARKLRSFILENETRKDERDKAAAMPMDEFKSLMIDEYISSPRLFDEEQSDLVLKLVSEKVSDLSGLLKDSNREDVKLKARSEALKAKLAANENVLTDEMKAEYDGLQKDIEQYNINRESIISNVEDLKSKEGAINRTAVSVMKDKLEKEEGQGSFLGSMRNYLLKGLDGLTGPQRFLTRNYMAYLLPNSGMDPQKYEELKKKGYNEFQIMDMATKDLYSNTAGAETGLHDLFKSETTDAYMNSEDRNMFEKALGGLIQTAPALLTGGVSKIASFASLAAQSFGSIDSEMRNNPEFDNVSEAEKGMIAIPYAMVQGALENLGFSKLMSKNPAAKSFTNAALHRVLSRTSKELSIDALERELQKETRSMINSGLFKIVNGALVEGETGALQEISDIGIKDVYNAMKGKDMFETPEGFMDRLKQVGEGAAMEAIGGGIMKTAMMSSSSIINKGMRGAKVTKEDASMIMAINTDSKMRSVFASKLKMMIINEEITREEANTTLKDYDTMMGIVSKIPEGTPDIQSTYDLVSEKEKLEAEIKGKDEAVSQKQRDRIAEINEELKAISKTDPVADPEVKEVEVISADNSANFANMTEDGEGNFVFYHYSEEDRDVIDPKKFGSNKSNLTSSGEKAAIGKVGGVSMFYTDKHTVESRTGGSGHMIKVKKEKVYDLNSDPLNLREKAKERHDLEHPGKGYDDNSEAAYVTVLAEENGFEMIVTEWKGVTRAQSVSIKTPVQRSKTVGNVVKKAFDDNYESNKEKGYTSVIPEGKKTRLDKVYKKIYKVKNNAAMSGEGNYDELYHVVNERHDKMTQEEITKVIEESDISDELKAEYAEAVAYEPAPRRSISNTKTENGKEKQQAAAGNRIFNEPLKEATTIADGIAKRKGSDSSKIEKITKLDKDRSKKIAEAYEAMEHDPNNLEVKEAYEALVDETIEQYEELISAGYKIEVNNDEPYANSQDMIDDLRKRKTMKIYSTESGYGNDGITEKQRKENPLLAKTKYKDSNGVPLLANDIFRFVHDFFGHSQLGNGFGPLGEENAWNVHSKMFSPKARRALTSETRGQNSWVNFSGVNEEAFKLRDEARALRKEGKFEEALKKSEEAINMMSFAEQKIGLIDEVYSKTDSEIEAENNVSTKTESEQSKKSVAKADTESEVTETFESAFTKGADSAIEWLDKLDNDLKNFGDETLGVNLPVAAARGAVKAAKIAAKTSKKVSEIIDAAITYVQGTKWYNELSDADKKKAEMNVQKLFTDPQNAFRGKSPKSKTTTQKKVEKTTGTTTKSDKQTKSVNSLRKEFWKMWNTAFKKGAISEKKTREELAKPIADIISMVTGDLKPRQVTAITNKALKMNLSNPVMASRFIDYVEKVAKDVDYADKLKNAFIGRKSLRKLSRGKNIQSDVRALLSEFSNLNPRNVEDIDQYNEMVKLLKAFAKPSSTRGKEGKMKDFSDLAPVHNYITEQVKVQEAIDKDIMELKFYELFEQGILDRSMSVSEMKDVIASVDTDGGPKIKDEEAIMATLKRYYHSFAAELNMIKKYGMNMYTGDSVDFSDSQMDALNALLGIDIDSLSLKETMQVVDMMGNLASNGISGNVENVASYFDGRKNAKKFFKKHGKAKQMNKLLRKYDYQVASLPVFIDTMLGGVSKAVNFMKSSGLSELIRNSTRATREAGTILDSYATKFSKKKPNGNAFNTAKNVYERGIIALLKRNVIGSETEMQAEFDRTKRILEESIKFLNSKRASSKERNIGKLYQEVYDKMKIESSTYENFESGADPINVEAVDWWINEWGDKYDSISDVVRNVYNREFPRDLNYTHIKYKRKESSRVSSIVESIKKDSSIISRKAHKNEAGALMEATRPNVLPKDRVIDLDFDVTNFSAMEDALTDIYTAKSIRKVDGFIQSEDFADMFSVEDGNDLRERITNYVLRTKGKMGTRESHGKDLKMITNVLAKAGTARALGGVDQLPKQTISVMTNTMWNSGGRLGIASAMSKDAMDWIDRSDMPIAIRGQEAETTIDSAEKRLDKKAEGWQNAIRIAGNINQFYLKNFLSNPDKWVARASFIAYYKKNLKSRGKSTDIDFSAEMDTEAADYAQHMVDRQQNISDPNLAGEFFMNQGAINDFVRKTLFPFANFIMNQKARMISDIRTLKSKATSAEDRKAAILSLAGLGTEIIVYRAMAIGINALYKMLPNFITGYEPDEEADWVTKKLNKEKRRKEVLRKPEMTEKEEVEFRFEVLKEAESEKNWKSFWTSLSTDILSPAPVFDDATVWALNKYLKAEQIISNKDSKEADLEVEIHNMTLDEPMSKAQETRFRKKWASEDAFQLNDYDRSNNYGVIGITLDKGSDLVKTMTAGADGTVTTKDYNGNDQIKYLTPDSQKVAAWNSLAMTLYYIGIASSDIGKMSKSTQKNLEKSSLTEIQYDKYMKIYEENGSVTEDELEAIKSGKKMKSGKKPKVITPRSSF